MQKTLILHDGEYLSYKQKTITQKEIATPIMTSNTTPSGLAFASTFSGIGSYPYIPFIQNTSPYRSGVGDITNGYLGYIFESPVKIIEYALVGANLALADRHPKDFFFEGSNDTSNGTDGTWDILDTQNNQSVSTDYESKSYPIKNNSYYKAYRIHWTSNNGHASYVSFAQLNLFHEAEALSEQYYFEKASDIQTEGMDSLSPLLDRRIETLEPLSMESLNTQDNGKIFSKTINLNKYIDIKQVKVDVK